MTFSSDSVSLPFLDLTIQIKNGQISTKTFRKDTAANTLLLATSHHPRSLIHGIPVGQFLRTRRNCSEDNEFLQESRELYKRFRERGYSHGCIRKAKKRAYLTERTSLLSKNKPAQQLDRTTHPPIRIITKFGAQWGQVRKILNRHWHILAESPILGRIVGSRPLLTARRATNLRDNLVHSEYTRPTRRNWLTSLPLLRGMFQCGRCHICKFVDRTDMFANSDGTKQFNIHHFINCRSMRVIYMLTCPCGLIYVGKTKRQLRVRVGEHVQSILNKDDDRPLSLHFLEKHDGDPSGLKCKGIYKLNLPPRRGDFDKMLYQKEKMWIFMLKSMQPGGLNNECNLSVFLEQ